MDSIRIVDHTIPAGVHPDMRTQGWGVDYFPDLYREMIEPTDIVVLATAIWFGDQSSMTRLAIERLYGYSGELNDAGQWSYYGKAGGVLVTGNEDGGKHRAAQMLYALSHIGFTIPPQADAYWVGGAGPVRRASTTRVARRTTGPPATPPSPPRTCSTPPDG